MNVGNLIWYIRVSCEKNGEFHSKEIKLDTSILMESKHRKEILWDEFIRLQKDFYEGLKP